MEHLPDIYRVLLSLLFLSLILTTNSEQSAHNPHKCVDCEKDFIYCYNSNKTLASFQCECSQHYPIVLDNRFCLPHRNFNQTCFLSEQCQQNLYSNIGCFLNGKNLLEAHNAVKHIVDIKSSVKSTERAYCLCSPNYYYDYEQNICLCKNDSLIKSWNFKESYCKSSNIKPEEFSVSVHYSETIVFWTVLMLILTIIFMLLTIYRKCYNLNSLIETNNCVYNYNTYEPTLMSTTTLINMQIVNNNNEHERRNLIQDQPPSYEEATNF
jgi:hypothetical protein